VSAPVHVVVVGGGVVGAACALALARRAGVEVELREARDALALAASGTNSGILHTGFDSQPGELETELILRAARLRPPVLEALGVPWDPRGAVLVPRAAGDGEIVAALAQNARGNGVEVVLGDDGAL
jgi:glycerol-3-phosphate dehydrogenase